MTDAGAVDGDLRAVAFFLADYAAVEGGKVYASGAFWDRLGFTSFPAVASFSVVAVLRVRWRDYHEPHRFELWLEDADSQRVAAGVQGEFQVGAPPDARRGDPTIIPIATVISNVTFAAAGDFAAVLAVHGEEVDRWRFRVMQVYRPAAAGPRPG